MWLLWQRSLAGPVLQVLAGGVPESQGETDPGGLGLRREVSSVGLFAVSGVSQSETFTEKYRLDGGGARLIYTSL